MTDTDNEQERRSYQKINYALRPAKAAERKMLCEGMRRLSSFYKIEKYRYIGFGSTYFSDFLIIHRSLGINNMVSIERNVQDKPRFEFNKPYKCIDLRFGPSSEILPILEWDTPTILWLDYDGKLSSEMLGDIGLFCAKAEPGSMVIISANAHPDGNDNRDPKALNDYRLRKLIEMVGRERVPASTQGKDLTLKGKAGVLRRIIHNEILETLSKRNGGLLDEKKLQYHQIFNFTYQDGAKMLTAGGVIYSRNQLAIFEKCAFNDLEFYKPGEEEFNIGIPKLTFREIRYLDKKLPPRNQDGAEIALTAEDLGDLAVVPEEDIQDYMKIYRYFPNFAEADI
ncbi:MAG: O-methyltransferase [Chloroflexota bacterium]|jgi:hypothetical protein